MTRVDADRSGLVEQERVTDEGRVGARGRSLLRRAAMRPRRALVRAHRWLAIGLVAWIVVVSLTGAWLVSHNAIESWLNPDRYASSPGDVGAQAALQAAEEELPADATVYGVTLPANGRGVYQVGAEVPVGGAPEPAEGEEAPHTHRRIYVDPGTGEVNEVRNEEAGFSWWLYRGHMYLWQDHGIFGVFDPDTGWCRVKGAVCDVIPGGMDMVAWLAAGFVVVLLTGFYLWYWPGVRRWATALVVRRGRGRFAFHMSVHKLVGLVVWIPLTAIAFTGMAFAFTNLKGWYENVTPAQRDNWLWVAPDEAAASEKPRGREPIDLDGFIDILHEEFPSREVQNVTPPADETGVYGAWVTRGFDPWTREGGAGNVWVVVDQYSGDVLYDGTPEDGNAFDQAWQDWSFPVHTGDFGGATTRILWTGLALTPLVLATTGITMNLVRRWKRARRGTRRDADDQRMMASATAG